MKQVLLILCIAFLPTALLAQTCYTLGPRNNGNGQGNTCGTPNCSGNIKQGHFDVVFATLPSPLPTMQLISVSSPPIPSPFCFDQGSLQSGTTVRYCFRGNNLPATGSMVIRFTQGSNVWSCVYNTDGSGGTILPVKLTDFDVRLQSGNVVVKWATEQEEDNEKFTIERSNENQVFYAIGSVNGYGNSNINRQYSYIDVAPLKGISFYRLKQIDIDGKFTYSEIRRIDNRLEGLHIDRLYPNPANKELNIQLSSDLATELGVTLYTITGQQVMAMRKRIIAGNQVWHLELPELTMGVYHLVIVNQKGEQISEKIIIN